MCVQQDRCNGRNQRKNNRMKTITAKYPGTCFECGKPFAKGAQIKYYGRMHCEHAACNPDQPKANEPDRFDMDYEDRCAEACGL